MFASYITRSCLAQQWWKSTSLICVHATLHAAVHPRLAWRYSFLSVNRTYSCALAAFSLISHGSHAGFLSSACQPVCTAASLCFPALLDTAWNIRIIGQIIRAGFYISRLYLYFNLYMAMYMVMYMAMCMENQVLSPARMTALIHSLICLCPQYQWLQ
mgnify:CR=1 FL=1